MKLRIGVACLVVLLAAGSISSCGGGGGGGGAALSPPAFTNLAGTRWNQTDRAQAGYTCPGVYVGQTDSFVLRIASQSGNTLSVYDERSGASGAANATISGYVVTYSGSRYSIGGCVNMTVSSSVSINGAGTSYSGSGTITCNDSPACIVPITITGNKI